MSFITPLYICLILVGPSLNCLSPTGGANVVQNSTDETELRSLAETFFKTWTTKDLDGFLRLWSVKSPELEDRRKATHELFSGSDRIELLSLIIRSVKIDSGQARLRVEASVRIIEARTGNEKAVNEKRSRTIECVKEAGHWKVQREESTFDEIAAVLASAGSGQQRAALLAEESELMTVELVRSLINQGNRRYDQGAYPGALAMYSHAQGLAEQLGDRAAIASAQNSIGNIQFEQGNYAQALDNFQRSLELSEAIDDKVGISNTLRKIGNIQFSQSDYIKASETFRRGMEISEKLGDKAGIARSLGSLGIVNESQGDYSQALTYYRKCLAQFEEIDDQQGIAKTLGNIAVTQHKQGNYVQSLESNRKSLALFEAKMDKPGSARTLNNLGMVYFGWGNYSQALRYFQQSLSLKEAIGDRTGAANTLSGIGNIHTEQGNYAQALEYYRKALTIKEALGNKAGMANALFYIGVVHDLQGNYAQALECLQQSLEQSEGLGEKNAIASTLNSIGVTHQRRGNYTEAMKAFRKSLAITETLGDKAGIATTLFNLGSVHHRQGNYAQALEFAERATVIARSIGASETLWQTLTIAGRSYLQLLKTGEAHQALAEAITTIESLRAQIAGGEVEQQRSFASKISPYHAMVDLLTGEGRQAQALILAERAKSRVLLDVLQTGRVNVAKALTSGEQEQEGKLRAEIISLNTQVIRASQQEKPNQTRIAELNFLRENARLNYEAFQTSLYAAHPELRAQRGEAPVVKAEELVTLLPDARCALIEYVVTDDAIYLFVITKGAGKSTAGVQTYKLPIKRDALTKQIESFRQQLGERDLGFRASARRLYQLLLKPAHAQLRGKINLIIVPDDKLWELPFQALLADGDQYLIEKSILSYAPSLTVLREIKMRHNKRRTPTPAYDLLALGNPALGQVTIERASLTLRDGKLDPLPEAEVEVKALGRLYGEARSKVYVGADAREDRVKTEAIQAGVIHFATHGVLNDASPMYSYLALVSGDKTEDGLLEAWELLQLDLRADLVVLSACETARGRFGAGEGMIGLTWAMFVAGAPAIVVSQWKVESASTRELMLGFHRRLKAPSAKVKATRAEALRQAALRLMKNPETSHPFYWAGFVLVGDGR